MIICKIFKPFIVENMDPNIENAQGTTDVGTTVEALSDPAASSAEGDEVTPQAPVKKTVSIT